MAKGMDVGTMALIGGGGYLALAYHSGLWPFNAAAPVAPATAPNYIPAKTPTPKPIPPPSDSTTTSPQACPTGYHRQKNYDPTSPCMPDAAAPSATYCDLNTPGWSLQDGVCKQTPAPTPSPKAISEQMITLAGTSVGLSMDQWCYYFTKATGNDCPVDPGLIDMTVYNGAGVVLEDGTIGDRTTPTDIGTWLSIMQLQAPQLGLSGLGDLSSVPTWGWLAAAYAALMWMGKR